MFSRVHFRLWYCSAQLCCCFNPLPNNYIDIGFVFVASVNDYFVLVIIVHRSHLPFYIERLLV
jgi:hypothetical protein